MDVRKAAGAPQDSPDARCEHLGDLAALAVPAEDCAPDAREWALVQDRLDSRRSKSFARRWWPAFAFSAVALVCMGTWSLIRRPVGYRLQACTVAEDGSLSTSSKQGGVVAFEDGSVISLDKDTRFRLQRLQRGAELILDRGSASLAVVHRAGARWAVSAGPFRIEVTGTKFDVSWSVRQDRLKVRLHEGEVRIRGGVLTKPVYLSAGQALDSDVARASLTITDDLQGPNDTAPDAESEPEPTHGPDAVAPPAPAEEPAPQAQEPSPPEVPTRAQAHKRAHPREEAAASHRLPTPEPPVAEATEQAEQDTARVEPTAPDPLSPPPTAAPVFHAPPPPALPPSSTPSSTPSSAPSTSQAKLAVGSVVFGADGHLSGPIHGYAWLTGGHGTVFTSPPTLEGQVPLQPADGQLCTSGRIVSVRCVNQHLPNMRCNWDRNWGVAIGFNLREDRQGWGNTAAGGLAIEFHGRSARYKLIAHLKNDPDDRIYCIENYKSGHVATPSMFKSECWANQGDALTDFKDVEYFQLNFPSGMDYVGFSYCISGITFYP